MSELQLTDRQCLDSNPSRCAVGRQYHWRHRATTLELSLEQQQQMQQQTDNAISRHNSPSHHQSTTCFNSSSDSSAAETDDRYKTELCRSFEENGTCRYGSKCRFAHGKSELRLLERHPKYKTEFCRTYHTSGFCPYGQRCHFIHSSYNSSETGQSGQRNGSFAGGQSICPSSLRMLQLYSAGQWKNDQRKLEEIISTKREVDWNQHADFISNRRHADLERNQIGTNGTLENYSDNLVEYKRILAEFAWKSNEEKLKFIELERKIIEPNRILTELDRNCFEAERRPLELEMSVILQRRRRQLRNNSVGSACETPPPFPHNLDGINASGTSSPISDDTRSPFVLPTPSSVFSPDIPLVSVSRNPAERKTKHSNNFFGGPSALSYLPHDISFPQTPPWASLNNTRSTCSQSSVSSPELQQLLTSASSSVNHPETVFLFDGDTLVKFLQRP